MDQFDKIINEIWQDYDKDKSGYLDKKETLQFVKETLEMAGQSYHMMSNQKFEELFKIVDASHDNKLSKKEMKVFILKIV